MRVMRFRFRSAVPTAAAFIAALSLAACSSDKTTAPAQDPLFKTMVVFGASLDDVGNTCNLNPAACPPPPYFQGRVSNGPIWVELVAQQLGASLTPSRTGGTNYAYSGARTGPIAGTTQGVPNMIAQVDAYLAAPATFDRSRALFVLNGATVGNDITDAVIQLNTNPAAAAIPSNAVTNLATMVGKLYDAGARHILIANSTDVGRTPQVRSLGAQATQLASTFSSLFNGGLNIQLTVLRASNAGLNLYLLDLGKLTADVFASPATFGFTNLTAPCLTGTTVCATPDAYFYWDPFHPTAATGKLVAARALTALGR
jgi:outer membrane lipase/esterase